MAEHVNVDNFVRAETARMFHDLQRDAGGVNRFAHNREPAAIDRQTVIRLNRDTLYSYAVVDASQGATLRIPAHGERYVSVMVVDEDHFVTSVLHDEGTHALQGTETSPHLLLAVRVLVDPADPADIAAVAALQDGFVLESAAAEPFVMPEYETGSFDATRGSLLDLARNLTSFDHTFGTRDEVDKVRHLIGTAAGWGGLPTSEAAYVGVTPRLPAGRHELVVGQVPVDGFWSISVYDASGFFVQNERGAYTINSITGVKNDDGTTTVRFGDYPADVPNAIPVPEGWNYMVRMYRPRAEILDGSWVFPTLAQG